MDRAYKILAFIIAACSLLAIGFGAWAFCDARWASAEQVNLLAMRLDQKINQDRYMFVKEQYEGMKMRYQGDTSLMTPATKKLYWQYECEINQVEQGRGKETGRDP